METSDLAAELLSEIEPIPVVDAHEHLEPEAARVARDVDVLELTASYVAGDLVAAGCPVEVAAQIAGPGGDVVERWRLLGPYWPKVRNGSYARAFLRTLQGLFGCDELAEESVVSATAKMRAANRPGWYAHVLRERCNIGVCILDSAEVGTDCDRDLFIPIIRPGFPATVYPPQPGRWNPAHDLIIARSRAEIEKLEAAAGTAIHSLDDLVAVAQAHVARGKREGAVGLKVGLAYRRSLMWEKVAHHQAETAFNRIFAPTGEGLSWDEAKPLQDYMLHQCVRAATDNDITIVFHTGLQACGNNVVANANPTLLTSLFMEYKEARFILLHAGYPYGRECGVLAKYFPNVWADLTWVHIISAAGTRQILADWMDLVPANKIIGFGGDVGHVELVYGHLCEARRNIAQVLAERVARGDDTEEEAVSTARILLHDSAIEAYRLSI